jgi:outer membrane protein assembly factor BamA
MSLDFKDLDHPVNPRQGYRWISEAELELGMGDTSDNFTILRSEMALYTSLQTQRQATLGVRLGGAHTFGTFPFFEANTLGGPTNLRGYRDTRFSGRSSFYANMDVRLDLFKIGGTILPGTMGTLGFFDVGRVWTDGESSSLWHQGYGAGLWYNIADEIVIRLTHGWSNEDTAVLFGAGFFF